MDDLLKNKFLWVVALITFVNLFAFMGGKLVVNKAADEVIERLRQDYSPSPYGPGLDPDKLQPQSQTQPKTVAAVDGQKLYLEMKASQTPLVVQTLANSQQWREEWERERGFSGQ